MIGWLARICGLSLVIVIWAHTGLKRIRNKDWPTHVTIWLLVIVLIALTPRKDWSSLPWYGFGSRTAYYSCFSQVNSAAPPSWHPNDLTARTRAICAEPPAFASMAYCYQAEYSKFISAFIGKCAHDYEIYFTRQDFDAAVQWYVSEYHIKDQDPDASVPACSELRSNFNGLAEKRHGYRLVTPPHATAIEYDKPFYMLSARMKLYNEAYRQFLGNYDLLARLGAYAVAYWFLCMSILAILVRLPGPWRITTSSFSLIVRQKIIIPAAYKKFKAQAAGPTPYTKFLVPTRIEVLRIVVFVVFLVWALSFDIKTVPGDPIFPDPTRALLRYYAVRASIIALSITPLVFLTAGRNNFLQWFTRWDYATFVALHRWLSRIVIILVVVHSVAYAIYWPSWLSGIPEGWLLMGIVGAFGGVLIALQSILYLRRNFYETFLTLHIILSTVFLVTGYAHSKKFDCALYYYVCFLIWYGDRIWRLVRLLSFGFPSAKCQVFPDETIKLVVPMPPNWEPIPGGHAYVYLLKPRWFRQSHPFTFTHAGNELMFFIKAKSGLTRELHDLIASSKSPVQLRVAIEGPYGEPTPANLYDQAVFVAGGSGIPGIFAEVLSIAKNDEQSLKLIWVVRDDQAFIWFGKELQILAHRGVNITLYVTLGPQQAASPFNLCLTDESGTPANDIKIIYRRPQIDVMVAEHVRNSAGLTCFVACGHPAMVDDIRFQVGLNARNVFGKRVDFFEQLQVWS